MGWKFWAAVGWPLALLLLLLVVSALGPGGVEAGIVLVLIALQLVVAAVGAAYRVLGWGKTVAESAAGVDDA